MMRQWAIPAMAFRREHYGLICPMTGNALIAGPPKSCSGKWLPNALKPLAGAAFISWFMVEDMESSEAVYIEAMLARTLGNRQLAIILFEKLFAEVPERLSKIEAALYQRQQSEAFKQAHMLHGSFAYCGFVSLQALAADLEMALEEQDFSAAQVALSPVVQATGRFLMLKSAIFKRLEI